MGHARSLAAAQTVPVAGDVGANLEQHLRLAALAAEHGARVLVFPELSLTGYEPARAEELAFAPDDPRLRPLAGAAARHAMTLVAGAPVRVEGRLHVGAFIVSTGGVDLYTKQHLGAFSESAAVDGTVPPGEPACFQAGDRDPLVALDESRAAVAICADTARPSHPRAAAERGATIYLASVFVIPSEFEADSERLAGHARRHSMVVVMSNYGGPTGGLAAAGRSSIWSERGELIVRLPESGAGVALATASAAGWRGETLRLGG